MIATFPAKKSILAAGTHMGMAATSVLEPIVLLYRATGDERYLQFARYIVKSWDEPNGPKIIATLLTQKQVNKTANGKAYEMLSNLVGLCELARATGDRALLEPVLNAWQDIVDKRLYLTGSASNGEHFQADYVLPNGMESQHLRDVRHGDLDPVESATAASDGRGAVRRRVGTHFLQPPCRGPASATAATGAITRPWKAASLTTRGSTAAIPAAPAAWPWPRRPPISAATTRGATCCW